MRFWLEIIASLIDLGTRSSRSLRLFTPRVSSGTSTETTLFSACPRALVRHELAKRTILEGVSTCRLSCKGSGRPFNFMLSRVRPNLRNNDGTAIALEALGLMVPTRMHERVIYAESFAHGETAFEIDPNGVAAEELAAIWKGVKERLHENEKSIKRERSKARIFV